MGPDVYYGVWCMDDDNRMDDDNGSGKKSQRERMSSSFQNFETFKTVLARQPSSTKSPRTTENSKNKNGGAKTDWNAKTHKRNDHQC